MTDHTLRRDARTVPLYATRTRGGMIALILVIALMLLLGIIAYAFYQVGGDVRRQVHVAYMGERAFSLARAAIDEAITDFQTRANTTSTDIPPEMQLSGILRMMHVTKPYSYKFKSSITTRVPELNPDITDVEVVVQRFKEGPVLPAPVDVSAIPKEFQDRIKKGWEEFWRTGYCGPDMDIVFGMGVESGTVVGMAAFKVRASLPTDRENVVREVEVRRTITHAVHSYQGAMSVLKGLGIQPPPGRQDLFGFFSTSTTDTGTTVTSDDIHVSPYDALRVVWRKREAETW